MTTAAAAPDPVDTYLPLAAVTLGRQPEPVVRALARLLEAAARGVGQVRLADLGLPAGTVLPEECFAVDGDLVLLPRYAACWREVRAAVEQRHGRPRLAIGDKQPQAARGSAEGAFRGRVAPGEEMAPGTAGAGAGEVGAPAAGGRSRWEAAIGTAIAAIMPPRREDHEGRTVFDNAQQRLALAALVDARIGVLTGGPGTGKTTSAAALIAVRKRLQPQLTPQRILLAAPTGKAACRLATSMARAAARLELGEDERAFLRAVPATTLHRALEWTPLPPERGGPFRRGAGRPLEADLVLVDEASMVDLPLMAHLLRAVAPEAALLLLGDSDQLESVETGGVLAELVARGAAPPPPALGAVWAARLGGVTAAGPETASAAALPGLAIRLEWSYRAKDAPWLLELAALARPGGGGGWTRFRACCEQHQKPGRVALHRRRADFAALCRGCWSALRARTGPWRASSPPSSEELDEALGAFQLLCGTNAQVEAANRNGLAVMGGDALRPDPRALPHGCPLLVTANSRELGLANGDAALALGHGPGTLAEIAIVPGRADPIPLARLPAHQPAFAITIHKSQGSEWRRVAIDLPDGAEELIDRNLLYTAITRSSGALDLALHRPAVWERVLAGG